MKPRTILAKVALGALIGALSVSSALGAGASHSFNGSRVVVESNKSFDAVAEAIQKLAARNGMMVMAQVNQGKMLSMTGLKLKARLFLIGNPNVGKKIFQETHGAGLYVPLRIFIYEDGGKTYVAYDKPSALLEQFNSKKVAMVGKMLDGKIEGLANMAAK